MLSWREILECPSERGGGWRVGIMYIASSVGTTISPSWVWYLKG